MMLPELRQKIRFNFIVNVGDGAFFGLASIGLASLVTVIPLFMNSLGASKALIGLVSALYFVGWQTPQLFTALHVTRLARYKPMVMAMTVHERWPYFGLAVVALLVPVIHANLALALTILCVAIIALGGGMAATAWQSMMGKIMPLELRGTFFGVQSALANLMGAGGAVLAGVLLERLDSPLDYALCFGLAGVAMMVSVWFLSMAHEPAHEVEEVPRLAGSRLGLREMRGILRRDGNFRWFLVARSLITCSYAVVGFYSIYTVEHFRVTETTIGLMTGVLTLSQTVANVLFGYWGDRLGHRLMCVLGAALMTASAGIAAFAPDAGWMYVVFALAGAAAATIWAVAISLSLDFGSAQEKPFYIGLSNTLVAPASLLAPVAVGLAIAGFALPGSAQPIPGVGYPPVFIAAAVIGVAAILTFWLVMRDPVGEDDPIEQLEAAQMHGVGGD
jgi:MFS family permease